MVSKFKLGQMVEWTSQAGGNPRTKIGIVVKIVRAGYPGELIHEDFRTKSRGKRDHESYVICVPNPEGAEFFWPRVNHLKAATRYLPFLLAKKTENVAVFAPPK